MPTTHTNSIQDANINDAIGSPTLATGDIVQLIEGATNYTSNLDALGTTQFGSFIAGPGYSGMIGDYPAGVLVVAEEIYIESNSPKVSIKGDNNGATTTDLIVWKNRVGGSFSIEEYKDLTRLDLSASGRVLVKSSVNVDNAYCVAGGLSASFESGGDAIVRLDAGVPAGKSGSAQVVVGRDVTTLNIKARAVVRSTDAADLATVNIDAGRLNHEGGDITNIIASMGATIDFSKILVDIAAIAWTVTGDITIIRPPTGMSVDMPTAGEQGSARITYLDAA